MNSSIVCLFVLFAGTLAVSNSVCKHVDEYGFGPDPANCHLYVRCVQTGDSLKVYSLSCGKEFWNQEDRTCISNIPETATCNRKATPRPEKTTTSKTTLTTEMQCPFEVNPSNHSQFRHVHTNEPFQSCIEGFDFDLVICTCLPSGHKTKSTKRTTERTTEPTTTEGYMTTTDEAEQSTTTQSSTTTTDGDLLSTTTDGEQYTTEDTREPVTSTTTKDPFGTTTTTSPPTTTTGEPLPCSEQSLIVNFPFDRNLNDISCNMNKASVVKNNKLALLSYRSTSRYTQAISFDGKYVVKSPFTNENFNGRNLHSFSGSFFFGVYSNKTAKLLSRESCEGSTSFYVGFFNGNIRFFLPTSTSMDQKYRQVTLAIPKIEGKTINHVAFSFSENTLTLFVNGVSKSVKQPENKDGSLNTVSGTNEPLTIGGGCAGHNFEGYIDDLILFKHGLHRGDVEKIAKEYYSRE